jgi:hypothetical protein
VTVVVPKLPNLVFALAFVYVLALAGCAKADDATSSARDELSTGYTVEKVENPDAATQPVSDDELLIIYTDAGTSGGGAVPVFEKTDTLVATDIKVGTEGFSTSRATYVYADGELVAVYDSTADVTVRLSGSKLDVGTHTVEAVQYPDNDPSGAATLYKKAIYEVEDPA